jgi:8-oxo-dGTP pyrophosphatase MutT (NUDIX family)
VYRRTSIGIEFLVLHRAHFSPDYDGEWAWTPPGGARYPNESVVDCAKRELLEETGLALAVELTAHSTDKCAVYRAEVDARAIIRIDAEHDRYEWLPFARAAAICTPRMISDYLMAIGLELEGKSVVRSA